MSRRPTTANVPSSADPNPAVRRTPPNRPRPTTTPRGFTLLDLLTALAVLGILVVLSAPPLQRIHDGLELQLAATEVAGVLRQARQHAVTHNVHVGVKFHHDTASGIVYMQLYKDGDGDGVRTRDIESGDDPPLAAAQPLTHVGQRVHFGFPEGPMPRNIGGRGRISRRHDPIRFNRSDIASFGAMGTATPGTLYLTDGTLRVAAIRISSRNARLRIYYWNRATGVWR